MLGIAATVGKFLISRPTLIVIMALMAFGGWEWIQDERHTTQLATLKADNAAAALVREQAIALQAQKDLSAANEIHAFVIKQMAQWQQPAQSVIKEIHDVKTITQACRDVPAFQPLFGLRYDPTSSLPSGAGTTGGAGPAGGVRPASRSPTPLHRN